MLSTRQLALLGQLLLLLRDNRTVGILSISSHLILSRALIRVWSHAIHFIHEEAAAQRAEGTSLLRGSCCVHVTGAQAVCRPSRGPECSQGPSHSRTNNQETGDKLPGGSWVIFILFVQLLSSTIHSAGQAAPVGIKGPAGSRHKRAAEPRAPPPPATSHQPRSPGESQKGGAWPHNRSRCYLTLSYEVCSRTAQVCQPQE